MTIPNPASEQQRRAKSDRYLQISQRLLIHALQQLDQGGTLQASERAYGAVSHGAKVYRELRGRNHINHYRVVLIYHQLSDEESDLTESSEFAIIESLHNNFLEYKLPTNRVRSGVSVARRLVEKLDSLQIAPSNSLPSSSIDQGQGRRISLLMQLPARERVATEDLPPLEYLPE